MRSGTLKEVDIWESSFLKKEKNLLVLLLTLYNFALGSNLQAQILSEADLNFLLCSK